MPEVKVNIGTDSVTGKKVKAHASAMPWDLKNTGLPSMVQFEYKSYEVDNSTPAAPVDGSIGARRAVASWETSQFQIVNSPFWIDPATKLLYPDNTFPGSVTVQAYFNSQTITGLPGVSGGDGLEKFAEGVLKLVVEILKANGKLPLV